MWLLLSFVVVVVGAVVVEGELNYILHIIIVVVVAVVSVVVS